MSWRTPATTWALVMMRCGAKTKPLPWMSRWQEGATPWMTRTSWRASTTAADWTSLGSGTATGTMLSGAMPLNT